MDLPYGNGNHRIKVNEYWNVNLNLYPDMYRNISLNIKSRNKLPVSKVSKKKIFNKWFWSNKKKYMLWTYSVHCKPGYISSGNILKITFIL